MLHTNVKPNYFIIPIITIILMTIYKVYAYFGKAWYKTLTYPAITPPNFIFSLTWTSIYLLSTIITLFLWNKMKRSDRFYHLMMLIAGTAILHLVFSHAFFYLHNLRFAFLLTLGLACSNAGIIYLIAQESRVVAALWTPFLLWTMFASLLNYQLLSLNAF